MENKGFLLCVEAHDLRTYLWKIKKRHALEANIVISVGGYIGDSTRSEIEYAKAHGKDIMYLEELQ